MINQIMKTYVIDTVVWNDGARNYCILTLLFDDEIKHAESICCSWRVFTV